MTLQDNVGVIVQMDDGVVEEKITSNKEKWSLLPKFMNDCNLWIAHYFILY